MLPIKYIALHHTAALNTLTPQLYAVDRYHREKWNMLSKRGWYVAYNYFCDVDGTRTQTRTVGEETIAQISHNCDVYERCDTISYCMAGDFRYQKPTTAQERDFQAFVAEIRIQYPAVRVVGHRQLQEGRTCPELPESYIEQFNKKKELDSEDAIKKEKIQELQSRLDTLRAMVAKLFAVIKSRT